MPKLTQTVKPKANKISSVDRLLALRLRALRDVETESNKSLKLLAKKTTSKALEKSLKQVIAVQKDRIAQLDRLVKSFEPTAPAIRIEAIRGMMQDGKNITNLVAKGPALDASIILELQYQAHYAMAGYGTARAWAEQIGADEIAEALDKVLEEKKLADEEMTSLAENEINPEIAPSP